MACYFDARWIGEHGIGRFATELQHRLEVAPLPLRGGPSDPIDPFRLARKLSQLRPGDSFFSPGYNGPIFSRVPYAVTVHDLNHIDCESNSNFMKRVYYEIILKRVCRSAVGVFTVSDFSKSRIIEWAGIDSDRVFNVGNGVSEIFSRDVGLHQPGYEYIFCVSNRRGNKNEEGVIKAFAASRLPSAVRLVVTGSSTPELLQLSAREGVKDRIIFAGRLSELQLAQYYRGAVMLLFPSFYEGFGLPIIEAFASDTPVITSNVTSMPEIAGDGAILVNPYSVAEISQAIERIYDDRVLRGILVEKGRLRQQAFTWNAVTDRVEVAMRHIGMI